MLLFRDRGIPTWLWNLHVCRSRIFRDAADQTLPVTEFSEICNWKIKFSYLSRNFQLKVTFGLLHLGKSGSFRHSVYFWIRNRLTKLPSPSTMRPACSERSEQRACVTDPSGSIMVGLETCCPSINQWVCSSWKAQGLVFLLRAGGWAFYFFLENFFFPEFFRNIFHYLLLLLLSACPPVSFLW